MLELYYPMIQFLITYIIPLLYYTILWNDYRLIDIISSTDVMQLTLTLKMTTAQVVETSVTVNNKSAIQDCVHPDDQTQPT